MKKSAALFILIFMLTLLVGCAEEKYPPVESTEEEKAVVINLKIEDCEYGVRYELYRALFLNNKSRVDGRNPEVWSTEGKEEYINKINELILNDTAEIYSVIHLAGKIGYDAFSDKANYQVKELFESDIERYGSYNELEDDEKYDAFLENLKKNNLNYGAADLLYRYALAEEAIENYYRTEYDYTEEDVKEFYQSDDSARILQAYFPAGIKTYSDMLIFRSELSAAKDEMSMAAKIIGNTSISETDLIDNGVLSGIMIGRMALSQRKYSNYINSMFSLSDGEMSDIITLNGTNADGYYIVYRLEKNEEHFETFYPAIANSYIDNLIGGILGGMENDLCEDKAFTESYSALSHKDITMN